MTTVAFEKKNTRTGLKILIFWSVREYEKWKLKFTNIYSWESWLKCWRSNLYQYHRKPSFTSLSVLNEFSWNTKTISFKKWRYIYLMLKSDISINMVIFKVSKFIYLQNSSYVLTSYSGGRNGRGKLKSPHVYFMFSVMTLIRGHSWSLTKYKLHLLPSLLSRVVLYIKLQCNWSQNIIKITYFMFTKMITICSYLAVNLFH